jgi:hypothetical protein
LTGSLVISLLGCLIIGFFLSGALNRRADIGEKKEIWFNYGEYMNKIKEIKSLLEEEKREEISLREMLEDSIFLDQKNQIWSAGIGSLTWYRLNGTNWVKDIPKHKLRHHWRSSYA